MSQTVTIEMELPNELAQFRLPAALHRRLQELLGSNGVRSRCFLFMSGVIGQRLTRTSRHVLGATDS